MDELKAERIVLKDIFQKQRRGVERKLGPMKMEELSGLRAEREGIVQSGDSKQREVRTHMRDLTDAKLDAYERLERTNRQIVYAEEKIHERGGAMFGKTA